MPKIQHPNNLLTKLLAHRKALKLTQKEAAKMLNMSVSTYGQIERGDSNLNLSQLVKIANFLDITGRSALRLYYHLK